MVFDHTASVKPQWLASPAVRHKNERCPSFLQPLAASLAPAHKVHIDVPEFPLPFEKAIAAKTDTAAVSASGQQPAPEYRCHRP